MIGRKLGGAEWLCKNPRGYTLIEEKKNYFLPPDGVNIDVRSEYYFLVSVHGQNFMASFTTLSMVICFSMGTLGIFATLVYVFTMVIYDILSMAIISILATSILFCNLCYILL